MQKMDSGYNFDIKILVFIGRRREKWANIMSKDGKNKIAFRKLNQIKNLFLEKRR